MDAKSILIGAGVSPAVLALLDISGLFTLTPLSHWGSSEMIGIVTYLTTIMSAGFASLLRARTNKAKRNWLLTGLLTMVTFVPLYTYISNTPPSDSFSWLYDTTAFVSYFVSYMAFGFSVGRIVKLFIKPRAPKQIKTGPL
jgi:hypothetical protein